MDDPEEGLGVIRSQTEPIEPPENSNMARELYEAFKRHSNRVLIVDTKTGREWTGARILEHCGRLATGLVEEVGLKPEHIVMTICDHNDQEILVALSVVLAGGALFGASPTDGYSELETLCGIVEPDLFIVNSKHHHFAASLRQKLPRLSKSKIVWLDEPAMGQQLQRPPQTNGRPAGRQLNGTAATIDRDRVHLVEDLLASPCKLEMLESIVYEGLDAKQHNLTYMLTSGSTGRPKVVPSTDEELVYGLYSMITACRLPMGAPKQVGASLDENNNLEDGSEPARAEPSGTRRGPMMPLGPDEIFAGDLPLDHGAGLNTMLLSLWLGSKLVVMPSYDVDAFWQAVHDYRITASIASTSFCYKLLARLKELIDAGKTNRWNLDSFKFISCCGAKLSFIELVREVQKHYKQIEVTQSYGCTEIGYIAMLHKDDGRAHLDSVGSLFPGIVCRLVDFEDQNKTLGANERGELHIWARSKFKNYRCHKDDNPDRVYANAHDERGSFYRTGDQAHFDDEGRLYIHGRLKDTLVLMEDWKILPAELERTVDEHPLVEMSAVVGVPDPKLPGCHAPKAFVKLISACSAEFASIDGELRARLQAGDLDFIAKHIYEFVAARTAKPKHLTGGVRFLDELPRVGLLKKVDRKVLRQMD